MTCSVYASKPYLWLILVLSAAAAAGARFVWHADPLTAASTLAGPPVLAAFAFLAWRRPVIRVDRNGVAYHPRWLPRIVWADVAGVERAALVEPTVDGLVYHSEDGRRPVLLVLRNADKYLHRLPTAREAGLIVEREAGGASFRLDFTGLSPASVKVYDCIRRNLAGAQSEPPQPAG